MKNYIAWIALGIALVAMCISLLYVFGVFQTTTTGCCIPNNHTDIISIIISSVALVISLYFIILGIHAHQIQKDIQSLADDIDKNLVSPATQITESYYGLYSSAIEIITIVNNSLPKEQLRTIEKDYLDKLKIAQARFACNTDYIDKTIKTTCINLLKEKSDDIKDAELMEAIISNPKSDKEIRATACKAYHTIKKRVKQ